MATTMLDHALAWARRGYRVFPLGVNGKRPAGTGWRQYATTNEEVITKWWSEKSYNIGVSAVGLIVVDVDVKNGKMGLVSYAELGLPTDTLTVRTPSGGFHYYFIGPDTDNKASLADGIDIRSFHGYVIAPGSVTEKGVYSLERDLPLLTAPKSLVALCGAPKEKQKALLNVDLDTEANVALARAWLEGSAPLACEGEGGDHTTYSVACKVRDFGVSEDRALDLLLDHWNDRCSPPWEPDELTVKVENAYTYATGAAGSLSHEAEFGGVSIPEPEHKPRTRGKWIDAGCALNFDQQWLFYQRLPRVGTAMMVGPSNSGKTFLALEVARCLATGEGFFGTKPDDEGSAIILSAEGVSGLPSRMHALGALEVSAMPVGALIDAENVKQLVADIAEKAATFTRPLRLIVVDTLTASGLLLDENNNSECGRAVKNLELLAHTFNCLVLVTHHPPKSGNGARGGSALHAGFDTVLEVFHDGRPVRYLECTKGRDAPTGKWGSFTLIPRVLGLDSRMREVTTCTVSMGEEARAAGGERPKHTDKFMEAFDFARAEAGIAKDVAVPRSVLRKSFGEIAGFASGPSAASKAFGKCLDWCVANAEVYSIQNGDDELLLEGREPIAAPD